MINSRTKGHAFERKCAALLRSWFPKARRGLQYQDGFTCSDVMETPFHVECKKGRKIRIQNAVAQATRDSKGEKPVMIISQEDHKEILVTMKWDDFVKLLHAFYKCERGEI
jgi:hypothetical protein